MFFDVLSFIGRLFYGVFAFIIILILTIIEAILRFFLAIGTVLLIKICGVLGIIATISMIIGLLEGELKFNSIANWETVLILYGVSVGFFVITLLANLTVEAIGSLLDKLKDILRRR